MSVARNRGYVKWGKRQLQEVRNPVFSPSLKANSYPSRRKHENGRLKREMFEDKKLRKRVIMLSHDLTPLFFFQR